MRRRLAKLLVISHFGLPTSIRATASDRARFLSAEVASEVAAFYEREVAPRVLATDAGGRRLRGSDAEVSLRTVPAA